MAKKTLRKPSRKRKVAPAAAGVAIAEHVDAKPATKTAAAKKWIAANPTVSSYADIIAGIKHEYGFDVKAADIANAKTALKKTGALKSVRKPKASAKRRPAAARSPSASKSAGAGTTSTSSPRAIDIVGATLSLVEAVGLDQARAIIAGLGK